MATRAKPHIKNVSTSSKQKANIFLVKFLTSKEGYLVDREIKPADGEEIPFVTLTTVPPPFG